MHIGNILDNLNGIKPQALPKINYHKSYFLGTWQRVPGGQGSGQNENKQTKNSSDLEFVAVVEGAAMTCLISLTFKVPHAGMDK